MRLSKTSAQAALAVAFLATQTQAGPVRARQVAEHLHIPTDSALKILQALVRQELIRSQLGRRGGYQLVREASSITLLDIVEAIDGPVQATVPLDQPADHLSPAIAQLRRVCETSARATRQALRSTTIDQLHDDVSSDDDDHNGEPADVATIHPFAIAC